jgi:hypothetical protein
MNLLFDITDAYIPMYVHTYTKVISVHKLGDFYPMGRCMYISVGQGAQAVIYLQCDQIGRNFAILGNVFQIFGLRQFLVCWPKLVII